MGDGGLDLQSTLTVVRRALASRRPRREELKQDAVAGLPQAVSSVPDGLATATLVGVNPVFGLYAAMAGQVIGGLTASTRLMVVTTTTAAALAAGSALEDVAPAERPGALVMLTVLTGLVMFAAGIFQLGRFIRFVSRSVMLGFLTGVSVNIVFGQVGDLVGAQVQGDTAIAKAFDAVTHPGSWSLATTIVGIGTLVLLLAVSRTRFAVVAALVAVALPTLIVFVFGLDSVETVSSGGPIPSGLPSPAFPRLSNLSTDVVVGALAVAAIVLIQGAGVAQAAPNVGGRPARTNSDFVAQGLANLGSGLLHGIPVGGSVSATALNQASGARSRWASILSGVWIALILVALSPLIGEVVVATLAAVLMYVGVSSIRPKELLLAWHTGSTARVGMAVTFVSTLALPIAAAVGVGIIVSLMMQLNRGSLDLKVVQLIRKDGRLHERPAPAVLEDRQLVVLEVYGSLLYAGSQTLRRLLPDPTGTQAAVVVLRLRGHSTLGATFFSVIAGYAELLSAGGGRLYLSGVDPAVVARFEFVLAPDTRDDVQVFQATEVVGDSTVQAVEAGRAFLVGQSPATGPR